MNNMPIKPIAVVVGHPTLLTRLKWRLYSTSMGLRLLWVLDKIGV